jgi:hypothetical protein
MEYEKCITHKTRSVAKDPKMKGTLRSRPLKRQVIKQALKVQRREKQRVHDQARRRSHAVEKPRESEEDPCADEDAYPILQTVGVCRMTFKILVLIRFGMVIGITIVWMVITSIQKMATAVQFADLLLIFNKRWIYISIFIKK